MIKGKEYYESLTGLIIKPRYVMYKHKKYDIISTHPSYQIKKYYIIVNNKKDRLIKDVIIYKSCHPNAWGGENKSLNINYPPKYSKFCLPTDTIGSKLISDRLMQRYANNELKKPEYNIYSDNSIQYMLMSWSLDDPHHLPLREHLKTKPPLPREIIQ